MFRHRGAILRESFKSKEYKAYTTILVRLYSMIWVWKQRAFTVYYDVGIDSMCIYIKATYSRTVHL
jgi:hypothetical protein